MSLVDLKRDRFHPNADTIRRGRACYYCGKVITSPAVIWSGFGDDIALHPACVLEWTIRLMRDVWQVQCEGHLHVELITDKDDSP
jgi:hypothetical protein